MEFPMLTYAVIFLTSTAMVAGATSGDLDITMALAGKSDYTNVVQAFEKNNLMKEITSGSQPITLLAPTNSAFAALPKGEVDAIQHTNTDAYLLRYHVLIGYFKYVDLYGLSDGSTIETLAGPRIDVTGGLPGGRVRFTSNNGGISYLSQPDVVANGQLAILGVNAVLIPASIIPPSPSTESNLPSPLAALSFPPGTQIAPTPGVSAAPVDSGVPLAMSPPPGTSVVVSGGSKSNLMGVAQWSHRSGLIILCLSACVGFVVMAPGNFFP